MKSTEIIELVTDAVCDAVKGQLGPMIAAAVAEKIGPALQAMERDRKLFEAGIEEKIARLCTAHQDTQRAFDTFHAQYNGLDDKLAAKATAEVARQLDARGPAERGPPGERGEPGRPGRDGRDATFAAVRQWKEGAQTDAGACVTHKGGLWLAQVDTDSEPGADASGFTLVLDGALPAECQPDERGYLQLILQHASGTRSAVPMHYRPQQYAGLYEPTRAYEPNDTVTAGGSLWLARAASKDAPPGTDAGAAAWLLIVKRGKDGKDGLPGPRGDIGQRGEKGDRGERGAAAPAPAARRGMGALG